VPTVLVTQPEFRRAESVFASAAGLTCIPGPVDEGEFARAIAEHGARHVVIGYYRFVSQLYDALPRGGVIARFGVGHDGVDKAKATRAGLYCTNTPGVLDQSVAEHAVALMLAAARHVVRNASDMQAATWDLGPPGSELRGKTLAVIGCGPIARATARIASRGFGMRVVAVCRSHRPEGEAAVDLADVTTDFAFGVRGARYVSVHINAEPANGRFIDSERLAMLSPDTWLINTARGAVVDEEALYGALASGRLGGAALDVFEREPYVPSDASRDLRTLPNVILTPHVGSHTAESNRMMAERALANIRFAEAGEFESMDLLNPQVLERLGSDPGLTPV
jgi:phosphoglycerate dehydrogenase-like enzyme